MDGQRDKTFMQIIHSLFDKKKTAFAIGMVTLEESSEAANTIRRKLQT